MYLVVDSSTSAACASSTTSAIRTAGARSGSGGRTSASASGGEARCAPLLSSSSRDRGVVDRVAVRVCRQRGAKCVRRCDCCRASRGARSRRSAGRARRCCARARSRRASPRRRRRRRPPPRAPPPDGDGDGDGDGDDEYEYEYEYEDEYEVEDDADGEAVADEPAAADAGAAGRRRRRGRQRERRRRDGDGDGDGLGGPTLPSTLGDPFVYFEDPEYERFVNMMMMKGKKQTSRTILWKAFAQLREGGHDPMPTFRAALANARPMVELRTRRNNQVPFPLTPRRAEGLAMKWLVWSARKRNTRGMAPALAAELLAASQMKGGAVGRRDEMHKSALANQAAAHFRWRGGEGGAAGAIDMEKRAHKPTGRRKMLRKFTLQDALETGS